MNFGEALAGIKAGQLWTRSGWNGVGMYVFLVQGSSFKVNRAPLLGIFPEGWPIEYRPHIDMKAADGTIGSWLASQTDVLADDWYEVKMPVDRLRLTPEAQAQMPSIDPEEERPDDEGDEVFADEQREMV